VKERKRKGQGTTMSLKGMLPNDLKTFHQASPLKGSNTSQKWVKAGGLGFNTWAFGGHLKSKMQLIFIPLLSFQTDIGFIYHSPGR
jgi:hypothetical protein